LVALKDNGLISYITISAVGFGINPSFVLVGVSEEVLPESVVLHETVNNKQTKPTDLIILEIISIFYILDRYFLFVLWKVKNLAYCFYN
jgi:hypothetical protein